MMNRNKRMEILKNAGADINKYFTVNLNNGTKVHLIIDENGNCTQIKNDPIAEQIYANGYVKNTKLHRRFIMAQMFHALNYVSYDGKESGYNAYLRTMYGYHYTLTMMLEEVRVLSKLETSDKESFDERSHFFTKDVVLDVLCDYIEKLKDYIDQLPTKKCKGVPYKTVKGKDVFVDDIGKKIIRPLLDKLVYMKSAKSYFSLHNHLKDFMRDVIKLPHDTPKSRAWLDAYKGEGAYYTLKNLIMFHGCHIEVPNRYDIGRGVDSMSYLEATLDEYRGEGWRMFALMKKVIADNNFNFSQRMHELEVRDY